MENGGRKDWSFSFFMLLYEVKKFLVRTLLVTASRSGKDEYDTDFYKRVCKENCEAE